MFVALAFGVLTYAFVTQDFSVAYVAQNSNLALPWYYRFSAVWGAHEGSLLLWLLILNIWTVAVATFSRRLPDALIARVLGVLGFIAFGFLLFTILTSNPFVRHLPALADGNDLNPILQDPGLIMHPPMLYTGYVGFSVAFAFAIAALLGGELDVAWVRWARPWTNVAWAFLTLGITLGSWWAYYVLGWGGWWFWDPVENASFMPWLVGTALIHSQAVTEKRGSVSRLDAAAIDFRIFPFSTRHVPRALGRAHQRARIRFRSAPRPVHSRVSCHRRRRLAADLRDPCAESRRRQTVPYALARNPAADQQSAVRLRGGDGAARHAVSIDRRCARRRPHLGRSAVFRFHVRAAHAAGRSAAAVRTDVPLGDGRLAQDLRAC